MNITSQQASDFVRRYFPHALGLSLIAVLWARAGALDWLAVHDAFRDIPFWRWVLAGIATAASFWAVAQYDVIGHRHLRTNRPDAIARRAGAAAIGVGQTTGFGPAVGAALRWRLMPDLHHSTILRLTGFVTLNFMAAWALIAGTVAVPVLAGLPWLGALLFPLGLIATAGLLLRYPRFTLFGQRLDLPSIPAFVQLTGLAALDVIFAGTALYLLLPPELAPSLPLMIAAFTLALGAGMIGGTPGGVGPFELALITVLPGAATPELAAALIAFRMVYYAIPCVAGAAYAFLTPPWRQPERVADTLPARGPRAELGIAAQNDFRLIESFHAEGVALRTPQSLTLFLGATHGSIAALLAPLSRAALAENRLPCIYKLTARDAALVRRAGWHVVPFAVEAVIDPQRFSLDGSDSRQLRRFLRKAETSGLEVREITDPDWEAMTEIHCAWEESHGRERGLTMGRFCPLYLRDKPLFGAYHEGRLIAFTSWLEAPGTLSLDVLRHEKDLPQGTMHALIHGVIAQARAQGLTEVNLAALPHPSLPERLRDCAGLTRFKTSFAPAWRPLYIAAPNAAYLAVAAADIRLAIIEPRPLTRSEEDLWDLDALIDSAMLPEHFSEQFTDEIDLAHLAPEVPELRRAG